MLTWLVAVLALLLVAAVVLGWLAVRPPAMEPVTVPSATRL